MTASFIPLHSTRYFWRWFLFAAPCLPFVLAGWYNDLKWGYTILFTFMSVVTSPSPAIIFELLFEWFQFPEANIAVSFLSTHFVLYRLQTPWSCPSLCLQSVNAVCPLGFVPVWPSRPFKVSHGPFLWSSSSLLSKYCILHCLYHCCSLAMARMMPPFAVSVGAIVPKIAY